MELLVWTGAAVTLAGVALLVWCATAMLRARRSGLDEAALRDRLGRIVPLNLLALFASALGLMMVVVGIALG
ncbi:MAG: hypothetical protein ACKVPY_08860 [Paracoccaceae bacterium]